MDILGITLTELVGYLGSLGVLVSFLFKDMRKLRIINTIGCILFVVYGSLLNSPPIIITNVAITIINIYFLMKKE